MLSKDERVALGQLWNIAPGELRYWPTHYMGTTPYIIATDADGRETRMFVAESAKGKTADTELRPSEGDRAIAYAKRMTQAANVLPALLAHIAEQEKRIAEVKEALRSMVTVYVGVIHDHFDTTINNHVLEEPPVKRARILLGLDKEDNHAGRR